ncbi:MAG: DUF4846 domain-containing protein [Candidatus Zixiibacteriota bacterium]
MGRIKKVIPALFVLNLILFFLVSSLLAEKTEEFEKLLEWYHKQYSFISMKDTIFTFESEFDFPDGYHRVDSTKLSSYANWISHFPLWHRWKAVGSWNGTNKYEKNEISRAVHLPWKGSTFVDFTIPIRILGEYLHSQNMEYNLSIIPKKGETFTYEKWLNSKLSYAVGKRVIFKPSEKRDSSVYEFYRLINFCMQNTNYKSLAENCDPIPESNLAPGDMYIAHDSSGRKGQVLIILNMIVNENDERFYIIATGCEKACDFHIPLIKGDRDYPWMTIENIKEFKPNMTISGFFRFKSINNLE